jgi:hypothetical protein
MPDDLDRLHKYLREGQCCAVALVRMGLDLTGGENPQLLQAVSGLCGGVQDGLLCGALTGGACLLNVVDPLGANAFMVPELAQWFRASMGEAYGGCSCEAIVAGDAGRKRERCPAIVEATWLQARDILRSYGHDIP